MSVHEAGYWRLIKTAVEAAKLRRASALLPSSLDITSIHSCLDTLGQENKKLQLCAGIKEKKKRFFVAVPTVCRQL